MGEGLQFLDIILFAMVAGFIFLRLRSVLGRRTGEERRRPNPYAPRENPAAPGEDNVVQLPERGRALPPPPPLPEGTPLSAALTQIRIADPQFEPTGFLQGARGAYEMIVDAFAKGDRETLRMLTSPEVFAGFDAAISERERNNQTMETAITAMKSVDIADAVLADGQAEVTVKFVSTTVSAIKDADGEPVGGLPREREVIDVWTFARDTRSRDPNWVLIATGTDS